MATATIVNHTDFPYHLQAMIFNDVQTVNVPPTTHDAPSEVMAEFVVWQDLDPAEIEVLYYTDNDGNILYDAGDIPPDQIQPPFEDPNAPPAGDDDDTGGTRRAITAIDGGIRRAASGRAVPAARGAYSPSPGVITPAGLGFSTINAQVAQPPTPPEDEDYDDILVKPPGQKPPVTEVPPTAPPVNRDVPYLSGANAVGSTLNCTKGNWDGMTEDNYTYQFKSDGTTDLTGTGADYVLTANDAGHSITCVVTATNSLGSTAAPPSNAIAIPANVTPPAAPPVNVDVPHLQGNGTVGSTLTCTMGNWDNVPDSYAYAWKSDGTTDLIGTGNTYTTMPSDDTHSITCIVTATNTLGTVAAPPSNAIAISGIARGLEHPLAAATVIAAALTPNPPAADAASAASAARSSGLPGGASKNNKSR